MEQGFRIGIVAGMVMSFGKISSALNVRLSNTELSRPKTSMKRRMKAMSQRRGWSSIM